MKLLSALLGGVVVLLLSGCVVGMEPRRPGTAEPAAWKHGAASSSGDLLVEEWWRTFGDATLTDLVERALAANQDLVRAMARVEESRAALRLARSEQYPAVSGSASYERSRISLNGSQGQAAESGLVPMDQDAFQAAVEGTYELDLWGRVRRTVESSNAQFEAARAASDSVRLSLIAEVADTYFALRTIDAEIEILRYTVGLRDQALQVNRERLKHGVALPADVSRAETELANVTSDMIEASRRRHHLENNLAVLCGEAASGFTLDSATQALSTPPEIPLGLPSSLLLRRPDVAEAERVAASRCAEIGVAKAAFLPAIKITGIAALESIELNDLLSWNSRMWAFGPSVTVPVFSGGKNRANLAVAEARYEQAVAAYRQSVLSAFREVESALASIRAYRNQACSLTLSLDSARRTAEYFDLRLQGGMIGYLEIVEAQRTLLESELAIVQNRGAQYAATIQLIKSLGGGWESKEFARLHP